MKRVIVILLAFWVIVCNAQAPKMATTEDGKKVLLKENGRWEYVSPKFVSTVRDVEKRESPSENLFGVVTTDVHMSLPHNKMSDKIKAKSRVLIIDYLPERKSFYVKHKGEEASRLSPGASTSLPRKLPIWRSIRRRWVSSARTVPSSSWLISRL